MLSRSWGSGFMLGAGTATTQSIEPIAVAAPSRARFVSIACGSSFAAAIDTSGQAWECGGPTLPGNTAAVGAASSALRGRYSSLIQCSRRNMRPRRAVSFGPTSCKAFTW